MSQVVHENLYSLWMIITERKRLQTFFKNYVISHYTGRGFSEMVDAVFWRSDGSAGGGYYGDKP